uniref:FkbM family methyltransferase n=1 Tax=Marinobacter sp. TaxID=50741 RepID=UPI00356B0112
LMVSGLNVSLNTASNKRKFSINADGKQYAIILPDWETDYIQGMLANKAVPYELDMLQAMRDVLDADDLVLDVGANIGNHTLYLAMVVGCCVFAFEPNAQLANPLQESIAANKLDNRVTLIAKGVGAAPGTGAFLDLKPDNLGAQSLTLIEGSDSSQHGALEVIPLDSLEFDRPVKAVKVDVEGMELDVLKGASKLLEKDRPELFIESQKVEQFAAIHDHLERLGYVYWQTFNATPTNWFRPAEAVAKSDLQQRGLAQGKTLYKLWEEKQRLRSQLKSSEKK